MARSARLVGAALLTAIPALLALGVRARPAVAAASTATWTLAARIRAGPVTGVAVAPSGRVAALLQARPARVVWIALPTGRRLASAALPRAPMAAAFSSTGAALVVSYADCAFGPAPCAGASVVSVVPTKASRANTLSVGSGAGALAVVPGSPDVLVAASGAGTVSVIDTAGTPSVAHVFRVADGILTGLAVSADGTEAAVANASAGTVTLLDLESGAVGAVGNVSNSPGPLAFGGSAPYVFAGETEGDVTFGLHLPGAARTTGFGLVEGTAALLYLPKTNLLAASSLRTQTVVLVSLATSRYGGFAITKRVIRIGVPARGTVSGLAAADGGAEVLAIAEHGFAVIDSSRRALVGRLQPKALGGEPTALATDGQAIALVVAGGGVDVLVQSSGGGKP